MANGLLEIKRDWLAKKTNGKALYIIHASMRSHANKWTYYDEKGHGPLLFAGSKKLLGKKISDKAFLMV